MGENTKIEWAHHTFNPWYGCQKVSPACDHCYAEGWAKRSGLVEWGPGTERRRSSHANWRKPLAWNAEAERLGVRYRVFCASLADWLDNAVPIAWPADLLSLIRDTPNLDWLMPTKRIGNFCFRLEQARDYIQENWPAIDASPLCQWIDNWLDGSDVPEHVFLGITVCDQEEANRDIHKLLAAPAAKRFLSIEPLLGPVDLRNIEHPNYNIAVDALGGVDSRGDGGLTNDIQPGPVIDWVIVGGESGPHARPMHPEWVRSLRDQCVETGVPFFFKQWGEWVDCDNGPAEDSAYAGRADCWAHIEGGHHGGEMGVDFFYTCPMYRVGKKAAGRLLDGIEHNGYPVEYSR